MMKFDLPKDHQSSIIKVIGVGGGGSNAVNHMYSYGIKGVDFIVCNTDQQALDISAVPTKIALGASLTEGRGAGSIPEIGRNAAIENIEDLKQALSKGTKMIFITAGMGGGTGTGAAPIIAKTAKEMGILTVGIVTIPFLFEGKKRRALAAEGIEELRKNVDTLLVISNDRLREMYGNLSLNEAFAQADNVLTTAAKGIAEIITVTGKINVDFNDVHTVMKNGGSAIMGAAKVEGESRAIKAAEQSLHSPLLNDNNIKGANQVLLYITSGTKEATMDEVGEISEYIQSEAGDTANIIMGIGTDETLGEGIRVVIIATGVNTKADLGYENLRKPDRIVRNLVDDTKKVEVKQEVVSPFVQASTPSTVNTIKETLVVQAAKEEVEKNDLKALEPFLITKKPEPVAQAEIPKVEQPAFEFEVVNTLKKVEPVVNVQPIAPVDEVPKVEETPALNTVKAEEPLKVETQVATVPPVAVTPPVVEVKKTAEPEFVAPPKKEEPEIIQVPVAETTQAPIVIEKVPSEEQIKKAHERIIKLKELSLKLKTPNGLSELENEPAYKRKNVTLGSIPSSNESQLSRYTLSEGEDKKAEIKPNNSFLHDNVD